LQHSGLFNRYWAYANTAKLADNDRPVVRRPVRGRALCSVPYDDLTVCDCV